MPIAHVRDIISLVNDSEAPSDVHEWSSTQVNLPGDIGNAIVAFAATIPETLLAPDGREDEPHVTVLYGIDPTDATSAREALKNSDPIRLKLGKLSLFETDDADVLKLDVESPDLEAMNRELREQVPHVEKQSEYIPHATVAYLKPGDGAEYIGKPVPGATGKRVKLDTVKFTSKDGSSSEIKLGNSSAQSIAPVPTSVQ